MNKILDLKTILEMGDKKDEGHHINVIFLIKVNVLQKITDRNAIGLEICRTPPVLSGGTSSGLFTFSSLDTANRMVQTKHLHGFCPSNSKSGWSGSSRAYHLYLLTGCGLRETPASPSGMCICLPSRLTMSWL